MEKRIAELDGLIKKLYEGNATGKIPDKHFNRLLAEYDTEQSALEQEAVELKEGITAQAEDGMRAQRLFPLFGGTPVLTN
jgi:site-specific DNA recombinase